jgi:multidrug efflux pump subunit AcrA (membrane-fusion protein)
VIRTEEAIIVPTAAVQRSQSGNYVFIMKDGKAHVQLVNISRTFQGMSAVATGLSGGEDVIVDGQLLLSEGTPVAPRAPKAGA